MRPIISFAVAGFFVTGLLGQIGLTGCAGTNLEGLDTPSASSVTTTKDYPAVVMVILPSGNGLCTGTFISPNTVLTAAHCTLTAGTYTVISSFGTFKTANRQVLGTGTVEDTSDISILIFNSNVASPALGQVLPLGNTAARLDHVRLVGFGCNNLTTEAGAGIKRTGTNEIAGIDSYINLVTPVAPTNLNAVSASVSSQAILGAANRAGSCFGDSGGPLLDTERGGMQLVGVVHAGGQNAANTIITSQYTNLIASTNRDFLVRMDQNYGLSIFSNCTNSNDPCGSGITASVQVGNFIKWFWNEVVWTVGKAIDFFL